MEAGKVGWTEATEGRRSSVYNKILSVPATQRREGRQIFGACRVPEMNTVTGGTARLDGREP